MRYIYTLLLYLLLPFALLRLLLRSLNAPEYRLRWQERFGQLPGNPRQDGVWIHAVSVGEVQAVSALVRMLLREHPDLPVHITTTTPTGSATVRRLFGEQVGHSYMPYDLPHCLNPFLEALRPAHLLMVETEIWPNLLFACRRHGISTLLANGRMSERSFRRYRRLGRFTRQVFGQVDRVAAQTQDDAGRFVALGVPQASVEVTGSIKFDMETPASVEEQVEVMRRNWGGRPVWVAGSTHEGEDEIMLAAHARLLREIPDALLVLVPRHPERFDRVTGQVIKTGLNLVRRSAGALPPDDVQVYLADTMGELPLLLGAADVAFIGGSLAKVGGHNMLEAAAQGVPVCFGPHTFNFDLISRMLLDCGAARLVHDAESLATLLQAWMSDASVRSAAGEAGRQVVQHNRGALARLYRMLEKQLGG
jgi:3-deoxy-D-manno-octulosonic-acid transferase